MASQLDGGGSTTAWRVIREYILVRDRRRCQIGAPGCIGVATHADHIVPRELGGSDHETNLRAACEPCNLGRPRPDVREEPAPRKISRW